MKLITIMLEKSGPFVMLHYVKSLQPMYFCYIENNVILHMKVNNSKTSLQQIAEHQFSYTKSLLFAAFLV